MRNERHYCYVKGEKLFVVSAKPSRHGKQQVNVVSYELPKELVEEFLHEIT